MSRPDHSRPTPKGSVPQPSVGTHQLSPTGGFALFKRRHDRKGVMMNRVWIAGAAVIAAGAAFSAGGVGPGTAKATAAKIVGGGGKRRAEEAPPPPESPRGGGGRGRGGVPPPLTPRG